MGEPTTCCFCEERDPVLGTKLCQRCTDSLVEIQCDWPEDLDTAFGVSQTLAVAWGVMDYLWEMLDAAGHLHSRRSFQAMMVFLEECRACEREWLGLDFTFDRGEYVPTVAVLEAFVAGVDPHVEGEPDREVVEPQTDGWFESAEPVWEQLLAMEKPAWAKPEVNP